MNMFYTGLGIARSLGERGVPVIGLTAQSGIYGNFTRYAKTVFCPDSRNNPEALARFLVDMGKRMEERAVIFPTRDDDLVFLDRFRDRLEPWFACVTPDSPVLQACLDKWQTYLAAVEADVPAPRCWRIESQADLVQASEEVRFPCVLKPLASHHWRQGDNWHTVGGRKAIPVASREELTAEYRQIARADARAMLQEYVPGGDEDIVIVACYLNRRSEWVTGFNTRKLVQLPPGFGTGCVVENLDRPELFPVTERLLRGMGYTGIAEVEYKWDAAARGYKLIEINPRPWDQHRLGSACGADLIYPAYCEQAGLPVSAGNRVPSAHKWIAEDAFLTAVLEAVWKRNPRLLKRLFQTSRGRRIYAIWSVRDPLPFLAYFTARLIPHLAGMAVSAVRSALKTRSAASAGAAPHPAGGEGA
jgi:predicted ATP-grasp superfamily ATP-dependent carboligase